MEVSEVCIAVNITVYCLLLLIDYPHHAGPSALETHALLRPKTGVELAAYSDWGSIEGAIHNNMCNRELGRKSSLNLTYVCHNFSTPILF